MLHYETEGLKYEYFLQRFYKYDQRISRPNKAELIQLIENEKKVWKISEIVLKE